VTIGTAITVTAVITIIAATKPGRTIPRPSGSWPEGHPAKAGWPLFFQRHPFSSNAARFAVLHDVTKSKLSADDTPAPKNNLQSRSTGLRAIRYIRFHLNNDG
jgi:hypothetical protein